MFTKCLAIIVLCSALCWRGCWIGNSDCYWWGNYQYAWAGCAIGETRYHLKWCFGASIPLVIDYHKIAEEAKGGPYNTQYLIGEGWPESHLKILNPRSAREQ